MTSYKGPLLLGVLVALFSALFLVGRAVDGAWLVGIVSNPVTLNVNAVLGLTLCGIGLALAAHASAGGGVRTLSQAIAAIVIAGAAASLSQDLFGWDFASLERMSPSAAYCFLLIGSALWVANWRLVSRYQMPVVMALGAVVTLTAVLSLSLHATSGALHTVLWNYSGIAVVGLDNDQRAFLLDGNSSHLDDQASYINSL